MGDDRPLPNSLRGRLVTTVAEPTAASIYSSDERRAFTLLAPAMLELDAFGTSDHIGFSTSYNVAPDARSTTWIVTGNAMVRALSAEVERLRDRVTACTGLTRQEIARAIGVDRRSLSGFVRGEIRPTEGRLLALRVLVDAAEWSSELYGEHAREVLRGNDVATSPLTLIADGRTDIRQELRANAERAGLINKNRVSTQMRATKEPLYVRAATAWAGQGQLPTRRGIPRVDSEYEQDLSKAVAAVALPDRPRRRNI